MVPRGAGRMPELLLVLTVVAGIVDAASILTLGHVFVANMTGNMVFLGLGLVGVPGFGVLGPAVVIGAFALGAFGAGFLADRAGDRTFATLRNATAVQAVALGIALVLTLLLDRGTTTAQLVVSAVAAAAMGVQNGTSRRIGVPDVTTSVITMTLSALAAEHTHGAPHSASRRAVAVVALLLGAAIGGLAVLTAGGHVAFGVAVVLIGAVSVAAGLADRRSARTAPDPQ